MSTTTRQNHIPTTSHLQTNATVIPCDIPKMRQPPRSAATPSVPRALALRWGARTTTNPSGSGGNWQIPFWAYPSRSEWGDQGSHIDLLFTESAFGVNSAFGNPSQKKNEISCRQVWQRCVQQPQSWHEIEIPNWDCPAKNIYKSRHVFFFLKLQQLCLYLALAR